MYKSLSQNIKSNLNTGWAVLPNETKNVMIKKMQWQTFEALDYRISNPINIASDKESIITGDLFEQEGRASYMMGFIVIKDLKQMSEIATMNLGTQTRYKNKLMETIINTLSRSEIRKKRGNRSVFVSNELNSLEQYQNNELLNKIQWDSAVDKREWIVVSFIISTSVFFNNYRVSTGIGNNPTEQEIVKEDIEYRLKNEIDNLVAKINNKLVNQISEDIYAGLCLVAPDIVLNDSTTANSLLDYLE